MALGLPNHLADTTMNRALARAANWFGLTCIAGALVAASAVAIARPSDGIWPTIVALVPMAILLITITTTPSLVGAIGYLVIGGLSSFVYTVTILTDPNMFPSSDMFVVALPAMALIMVGGEGRSPYLGVVWATAGLVIGEGVVVMAAYAAGVPYRLDWFVPSTWLVLVSVLLFEGIRRGRIRAAQPAVLRASRENSELTVRRTLEARATALVHDTALSHLIALSHAEPGPLDPRLRSLISADLERLIGEDWLLTRTASMESVTAGWATSPLAIAVDNSRAEGLEIDVAGDRQAIAELPATIGTALGLAVRQCLVNVLRHSGVQRAEIVITENDDSVSVMVTDAGVGFSRGDGAPSSAGIGLRQSVIARVEDVGGEALIWTRPGEGTTVMLSVPLPDSAPRLPDSVSPDASALEDQRAARRDRRSALRGDGGGDRDGGDGGYRDDDRGDSGGDRAASRDSKETESTPTAQLGGPGVFGATAIAPPSDEVR